MQPNRLFNLFRANAKAGEFRAEGNTLYLYDVIVSSKADAEWLGGVDAETFVQTLNAMTGDVDVRLNSPGGDVFAGVAMATAIKAYPGKVTAYVDGYAASAASVVAAAADSVTMAPGAFQMIHKAWTMALGNADDFMSTASLLEKIDGTLADGYADAAASRGKDSDAAAFGALMAAETWLTAQEAIDLGLADEIGAAAPKAKAAWDLSAYAKPPVQDTSVTITIEIADDPGAPEAPEMPEASNQIEQRQRIAALRLRTAA
jgi:ATP-dependent protease ClpP protease subunit